MQYIDYNNLLKFTNKILLKAGLNRFSAKNVTLGLCETSLRGVDSHGIRLLKHYVTSALKGKKNPKPNFRFIRKFPCISILEADRAFGHAAGFKAIERCTKDAKKFGVGITIVRNSTHPGALASIALKASREGFATFAFTNADSLMLSYNGKNAFFGTNPICFTAPSLEGEPFCLDMATTIFSWNKLLGYKKKNKNLPLNIAADINGKPTINPHLAKYLMPVGAYKGFGLASMVEILTAIIANMPLDNEIPPMYSKTKKIRKISQFYIVFRVDIVSNLKLFKKNLLKLSNQIRSQKNNKEYVMMPNDPEVKEALKRKINGIPLPDEILDDLRYLSKKFIVDLNLKT